MIENIFTGDDGRLVGEGFVDGAWSARVDEDLRNLDEGVGSGTEGEHLASAAGALIAEAIVEHGVTATVLHDEGIRGEAAVAGVGCGRLG